MKTNAIDLNLYTLLHNLEFYNNYIVLTIQTIKINIQSKISILFNPNLSLTHITAIQYKIHALNLTKQHQMTRK